MQKILLNESYNHLITAVYLKKKFNLDLKCSKIDEILKIAIKNIEESFELDLKIKTWKIIHDNYFFDSRSIDINSVSDLL